MSECAKCGGAGSYAYDENHGKICEQCCPCDEGWLLLRAHYGEHNGLYACKRGCGKTKRPDELGIIIPHFIPHFVPSVAGPLSHCIECNCWVTGPCSYGGCPFGSGVK